MKGTETLISRGGYRQMSIRPANEVEMPPNVIEYGGSHRSSRQLRATSRTIR